MLSSWPVASSRRIRSVPRGRSRRVAARPDRAAPPRPSAGAARARGPGRLRRLTLQRDPRRGVAREREAANPRILALLARREVHDRDAALDRPPLPPQALGLAPRRIRGERDPLRVVREVERRRPAARRLAAASAAARRRGRRFTDLELSSLSLSASPPRVFLTTICASPCPARSGTRTTARRSRRRSCRSSCHARMSASSIGRVDVACCIATGCSSGTRVASASVRIRRREVALISNLLRYERRGMDEPLAGKPVS